MKRVFLSLCAIVASIATYAQTPALEVNETLTFSGRPGEHKAYSADIASGKDFAISFDLMANKGGNIAISKSTALPANMNLSPDPSELTDKGWRLMIRESKSDAGERQLNLRVDMFSPERRYFAQCKTKQEDYFVPGKEVKVLVTFKSTSDTKGTLTVFLDGRQALRYTSVPYAADTQSPLTIGASIDGSASFSGTISNIKVYNTDSVTK